MVIIFIFPIADGKVKLSGGDQVLRTSTLIRDSPDRGGEQGHLLLGESQDSSPDDGEARNDSWSISGNYIYRHHVEPRVKLYVPREESFPIPLRYIDVTRATSATLGVMLWRRIDDSWNIEWDRDLSDAWTGFTRFTVLDEKPPVGCTWSGEAADKEANNIQAWLPVNRDSDKLVRCSATKKNPKVAVEKPKLENERRLRGIHFSRWSRCGVQGNYLKCAEKVGSSDASSYALQDQGKKSTGRHAALLMLTKQNTHASMKPTNLRESAWKDLYTKIMKTHCRKRNQSIEPLQSCAQFYSYASSNESTWSKSSSVQKMGKTGNWGKSETRKRWSMMQGRRA